MTYILRKGVSTLDDLKNGLQAKGDPATGKILFVNGVTWSNGFVPGNDGNSGESMDEPLHTLTKALDLCTDEGNDYIYILDYWQPTGETWPVAVNKTLVNIVGVGAKPYTNWIIMFASGSFPCMDFTGSKVKVTGLEFYPNASSPGVSFDDGCAEVWLDDCHFLSGTYGVQLSADDMGYGLTVTNSWFAAALSSGGIYVADDPAGVIIEGNHFDRHTGISIDIEQGAAHRIEHNTFAMKAATQGLAITLAGGVSRAFVNGNHAAFGANSTSITPYEDEGTVTTNNWGTNWYGKAVADPA